MAWSALLAIALGPTASVWHFAMVPHVQCEHGKLEHVRGAPASLIAPVARRLQAAPDSALAESDHDHCAVAAVGRKAGATPAARAPDIAFVTFGCKTKRFVESGTPIARRALLLRAPKTSPPSAA